MKLHNALALQTDITHHAYKTVRWEVKSDTGELIPPDDSRVEDDRNKFRNIIKQANKKFTGGIVVKAGGPGSGRHKVSELLEDKGYQRTKDGYGHAGAIYRHPDNPKMKVAVDDRYETWNTGSKEGAGAKDLQKHLESLDAKKAGKPKGSGSKPHHPGIAGIDGVNHRMRQPESFKAGGPGSGRKANLAKGLNKWKSRDEEIRQAQKDPKQAKLPLKAGEENVEMEGNPIRPGKLGKRIKKVGTQFCVEGNTIDKNLGCYPSREKAQAVLEGKSFIETDIDSAGGMPSTGWQYGKRTMPVGYVSQRTLSGFPASKGGGRGGLPQVKPIGTPKPTPSPKPGGPTGHSLPNPSMHKGVGVGHRFPNPSMHAKTQKKTKDVASFADYGEPMAGSMSHAHMDTNLWFTPPSLKKRGKGTYVPTDDPGEKDNKFLDVTKRKQAHKDRMKILKRSTPGGQPPLIPARTTLLEPHSAGYQPSMMSAGGKPLVKTRPVQHGIKRAGFVSYDRRGML